MIAFSRLRQRVTLEAAADAPDGAGGITRTWSPLATVHAQVRTLSGRERFVADGVQSQIGRAHV